MLRLVVQQVGAKNFDQISLSDKRRKRQKDKSAFRAVAAPALPARLARLPECRIAAPEDVKICPVFRKSPRNLDLRQWTQQGKIFDARRDAAFDISGKILLELEGLAVLVIDFET